LTFDVYAPHRIPRTSIGARLTRPPLELLQGTLDLLILKALSWGPAHGYAIARWIEQLTRSVLLVGEGSLYPAVHRLEDRGWVEAEWRLSEHNRRAKFYRLTARGRQQLRAETAIWTGFVKAVQQVLNASERPA
jgi:PadR family transcriptional regulator PadR